MINYDPLVSTLREQGVTMDNLMSGIKNFNLRDQLNSGRYISMGTLDKICTFLNCRVENVINHDSRDKPVSRKWLRGYEVDWGIVYDLLKSEGKSFYKASLEVNKKGSYFGNVSKSKITSRETVQLLGSVLKGHEISEYAAQVFRGTETKSEHQCFDDSRLNIE